MSRLKAAVTALEDPAASDPFTQEIVQPVADAPVEKPVVNEPPTAPITTDQLLQLIATGQAQTAEAQRQAAEANEKLAAAIIKTTEPREVLKSTKQIAAEENEKLFEENARILNKRRKMAIKHEQDNCDHIGGCSLLGEMRDLQGRTSILWHTTDVGVDTGICLVCQRFFRPGDPPDAQGHDYSYWRRKPSMCRISKAGVRTFLDPVRAMEESYLHDS